MGDRGIDRESKQNVRRYRGTKKHSFIDHFSLNSVVATKVRVIGAKGCLWTPLIDSLLIEYKDTRKEHSLRTSSRYIIIARFPCFTADGRPNIIK